MRLEVIELCISVLNKRQSGLVNTAKNKYSTAENVAVKAISISNGFSPHVVDTRRQWGSIPVLLTACCVFLGYRQRVQASLRIKGPIIFPHNLWRTSLFPKTSSKLRIKKLGPRCLKLLQQFALAHHEHLRCLRIKVVEMSISSHVTMTRRQGLPCENPPG